MLGKQLKLLYEFSYKANNLKPVTRLSRRTRLIEKYNKIIQKEKYAQQRGNLEENIKQERYDHKFNYNFEQYRQYTEKVREAKQIEQAQIEKKEATGRKIKRLYDKPRYDLDIKNYTVWQQFSHQYQKESDHSAPVVCKLWVVPKHLRYVFGEGNQAFRNEDATREYDFQDSDLSQYLIYDYRKTTEYQPVKSEEFYENQKYLQPRHRKQRLITPEEFWNSEEPQEFRVNSSHYGDFRKFRTWLSKQIEEGLKQKQSFHERVLAKYPLGYLYDNYETNYNLNAEPAVFKYDRSYFLEKGKKLDTSIEFNDKIQPAKALDDKYTLTLEQYLEIKRQEKLEQQMASRQ